MDVASTQFHETLKATCLDDGISLYFRYESGREFPSPHCVVNWAEWERFVAWVEWQRKEDALKKGKSVSG